MSIVFQCIALTLKNNKCNNIVKCDNSYCSRHINKIKRLQKWDYTKKHILIDDIQNIILSYLPSRLELIYNHAGKYQSVMRLYRNRPSSKIPIDRCIILYLDNNSKVRECYFRETLHREVTYTPLYFDNVYKSYKIREYHADNNRDYLRKYKLDTHKILTVWYSISKYSYFMCITYMLCRGKYLLYDKEMYELINHDGVFNINDYDVPETYDVYFSKTPLIDILLQNE